LKVTQPKLKMLALDLYVSDGSTAWRPAGATGHAARLLEESNEEDRLFRGNRRFLSFRNCENTEERTRGQALLSKQFEY